MKKKYTRKQILESIKYWKKQLKAGNYKKLDESINNKQNPLFAIYWVGAQNGEGKYYDNPFDEPNMVKIKRIVKNTLENDIEDTKYEYDNFYSNYDEPTIRTEVSNISWREQSDDERSGKGSLWIPISQATDSIIDKLTNEVIYSLKNGKPAIVSFGGESGIRFEIEYVDDDELKRLQSDGYIVPNDFDD